MFASRGTQSNLDTSRGRKTGLELVNINKTLKIARCFQSNSIFVVVLKNKKEDIGRKEKASQRMKCQDV